MANFFYTTVYQPLFNLLIFLYNAFPGGGLGLSIVLITVIIKGALHPLGIKAARSQKELQAVQPEVKKIQEKYKDDKETQAKKIMELYKGAKVNPFSGILPLFIQIPILISLFQIFTRGMGSEEMIHLYGFVSDPGVINYTFLRFIDLSSPNIFLAVIAGVGQFIQMKMTMPPKENTDQKGAMKMMQSQMVLFLPGFTFFILLNLPSAVGVYWIITVIFSIFQQYIVKKSDICPTKKK